MPGFAGQRLTIIFELGHLHPSLLFDAIRNVFGRNGLSQGTLRRNDRTTTLGEVERALKRAGQRTVRLSAGEFEFLLSFVANYHYDFLAIEGEAVPSIQWTEWIAEFGSKPHFVMAWIVDRFYDHWQNVSDPREYVEAGRPLENVPMVRSGLPPPLDRLEIDCSRNAGRHLIRDGYVEAVGSTMWLGTPFWHLTGADRDRVMSTAWITVSTPAPNVTEVVAATDCFRTSEGTDGELQESLRALLFTRMPVPSA